MLTDAQRAACKRWYEKNKAANAESVRCWKLKNPDKVRAKDARRRARTPEKYAAKMKAYREKNPERVRQTNKDSYQRHREKRLAAAKLWRQNNRGKDAANIRRRIYGTDGLDLFAAQKGLCAICDTTIKINTRGRGSAHLDHDHSTGRVRGWLCHACNVAIGMLREDPRVITRALAYVSH